MKYLLILAVIGLVFVSGCVQPKACTEEARLCPDGSGVGREGPDCEFAPCISEEEAIQIAENTEDCSGYLTDSVMYNSNTFTWWIDLSLEKEGCAPACVVSEDGSAEINWRCTGLIA